MDPRDLRIQELEEENAELRKLAFFDPLTGLGNRRYLQQAFPERRRSDLDGVGVIRIDLDHFKAVNDTWGHAAGDEVLQRVAHILITQSRPPDILCRAGGEEVDDVLCGVNVEGLVAKAEIFRREFERQRFASYPGLRFTASFGVAILEEGVELEECLQHADLAVYAAKRAGRNRVVMYDPDLESSAAVAA